MSFVKLTFKIIRDLIESTPNKEKNDLITLNKDLIKRITELWEYSIRKILDIYPKYGLQMAFKKPYKHLKSIKKTAY